MHDLMHSPTRTPEERGPCHALALSPPFTGVTTSTALPSRNHPPYIGVTVHDCRTLSYKPLNMSQVLLVTRVRSKLFGAATALRSLDRHFDLITRA